MGFLVDEELKENFLGVNTSENTYDVIKSRLMKIDKYEKTINKSIIDWSTSDIGDFLRSINSVNPISIRSYFSTAKEYVSFVNNTRPDKEILSSFEAAAPLFNGLSTFQIYTNNRKYNENILLYVDYLNIIRDENVNLMARTMFILFWNGVNVKKVDNIFLIKNSAINYEENYIINEDSEKIFLTKEEMEIIFQFKKDQEKISYPTDRGKYYKLIIIEESEDSIFHIIDPTSVYLFPDVIGTRDIRVNTSKEYRMYQEPRIRSISTTCYQLAYLTALKQYDIVDLKPKGIVKSGAYHRAIKKFNFKTPEDLDNFTKKIKITNVSEIKEFLKPYCSYQKQELEYILSSGIYSDETDKG